MVQNLARVGLGRTWLALGNYDSAAAAVTEVPNGFKYQLETQWGATSSPYYVLGTVGTISDREGNNGLPYRSESDQRTAVDTLATKDTINKTVSQLPVPFLAPAKYYSFAVSSGGYIPITVADWIEARLIQAEAGLQPADAPHGPWLATLNGLRTSAGLSDTTDPGTSQGRIALLFRERAYWLFLTGHRQGDLRRLIRQYGQRPDQVYPTGFYLAPGTGLYGTDITVPIPMTEYANPLFHGCLSRGA
jgi:hypothetical protein